jgi:hypothetical protein
MRAGGFESPDGVACARVACCERVVDDVEPLALSLS